MKKSTFTSIFAPFIGSFVLMTALLAGSSIANAQPYYGNYSYYGSNSTYLTCVNLAVFQGPGYTDSETGGQVSELQEFLNQAGYLSGVSGTYDNGTLGAVINYQRAYNLPITGTLTPQTIAAINTQSCEGNSGYGSQYPVTNYSTGNDCYWTGGVDNTYVCSNSGYVAPYVAPAVNPITIYPSNGYVSSNNNCDSNQYEVGTNYCNPNAVVLDSLSAAYSYNTATITITGYGFSPSGNTVYFGNTVVSNVYSPNGTTLTFTAPTGYNSGTYGIEVRNGYGYTSNTLSFIMNNNYSNGYNPIYPGGYTGNNYYNVAPVLSNISGPSEVQVGQSNTWTVTESNAGYDNYNSYNNAVTITASWGDNYVYNSSDSQQAYSSNGSQTYSFSHVYETPGTYTLRITATNRSGQSTSETYLITVTNSNYYYQYQQTYSFFRIPVVVYHPRHWF